MVSANHNTDCHARLEILALAVGQSPSPIFPNLKPNPSPNTTPAQAAGGRGRAGAAGGGHPGRARLSGLRQACVALG